MNLKTVSLLALTCLLASCGRTPEAVTPPVAATPSALYELHFQNLGSAQTTATAQRLGGGLGAQRLENAPEPLALGTTPLSTLEFVTTENGKSVRHAQATFKLTNTSGRTLKNLVFLPVALNDTDGDPSNNAQAPTAGGTPFRTVRYFDGSDASALAGTLTPVQGQQLNAEKTGAQADPDADAYFRGLSTAGLNVAAPAGLSVQVTDGGWLAATSLAAGASTNVTFAVDMGGVDPANLKATPYSFSLLVTGGEDATATDISSSVDPASLQGVLPDWKYGEGWLGNLYSYATFGTVSAGGVVGGKLPANPAVQSLMGRNSYSGNSCTFTGTQTAGDIGTYGTGPELGVFNSQNDRIGTLTERTPDDEPVARVYSDADAIFKGTLNCWYSEDELDLNLRRGWNVVALGKDGTVRSLSAGTRTVLKYVQASEGIVVSLNQSYLELRAGQSKTLDVRLNQTGAISGDVTLETDVPGVTVTPATVTLPSLSATSVGGQGRGVGTLGLGAQAVSRTLTLTVAEDAKPYYGPMNLIVKKGGVEVGRATVYSVSLTVPSVSAYFSDSSYSQPQSLSRGETQTIPVSLNSVNGFAGMTTVTLSGLPAGVTASTETVNLTEGGSTKANITLNVSAQAEVGVIFTAQLSGPKITASYAQTSQQYVVTPDRTILNLRNVSASVPAAEGVWILGSNNQALIRLVQGQEVQRFPFGNANAYDGTRLLGTPDGRAVVIKSEQETYTFTLYSAAGVQSSRNFSQNDLGEYVTSVTRQVDAQDNFWTVRIGKNGNGPSLVKANLTTGVIETFPNQPFSTYDPILSSPDGRILLIGNYGSMIYRINTQNGEVTATARSSLPTPYALDNSGNWYGSSSSGIVQVSPQGVVRLYANNSYASVLGIDRADSNTLWLSSERTFYKLDLTTGAVKDLIVYGYNSSGYRVGQNLDGGGGAWSFGSSTTYNGTPTTTYFASLVK